MPRVPKPLNDAQIRKAKPKEKEYSLPDGDGLFVRIVPTGSKLWVFNYRHPITKKRSNLGLGGYPNLALIEARAIREEFRSLLANGIDPKAHRQAQQTAKLAEINNTFKAVADEWFKYRSTRANFSAGYAKDIRSLINRILLPAFGDMPITQITAPMALKAFKPLQDKGTLETLKRSIQKLNEIMTYALHREIIPFNPTANLHKEFDCPTVEHFKTIKPEDLGDFLATLQNAQIKLQTRYLIQWQLLTMTRPNESASAKWADIDEKTRIWTIPPEQMKRRTAHKVTLSRQALALLREIKKLNGGSEYLFPSERNPQQPMNSQTANSAIKRMGYKGKLVAHGLRSIASTYLNEQGYNSDLIEVALSHLNNDRIKMAYDRGERIKQRFELLQAWADFVDECSNGALPKYHLRVA